MHYFAIVHLKEGSSPPENADLDDGVYRGKVCVVKSKDYETAQRNVEEIYSMKPYLKEFGSKRVYGFLEEEWKRNMLFSAGHYFLDEENIKRNQKYSISLLKSKELLPGKDLTLGWIYDLEIAILHADDMNSAFEKAKIMLDIHDIEFEIDNSDTRVYIKHNGEWLGNRIYPSN